MAQLARGHWMVASGGCPPGRLWAVIPAVAAEQARGRQWVAWGSLQREELLHSAPHRAPPAQRARDHWLATEDRCHWERRARSVLTPVANAYGCRLAVSRYPQQEWLSRLGATWLVARRARGDPFGALGRYQLDWLPCRELILLAAALAAPHLTVSRWRGGEGAQDQQAPSEVEQR